MSIYSSWGFSEPPFQTTALPPTEHGSRLLIGRDAELQKITRRLSTPTKLVTVEGSNGVGKTSLINVAGFRALEAYLAGNAAQLFIPVERSFQLTPTKPIADFVQEVAFEVAQTLIRHAERLKLRKNLPENEMLGKWLNSPLLGTLGGTLGATVLGIGGSIGGTRAESANTSDGFRKSGILALIRTWLGDIFPDYHSGGVVCIIDNLELLQTSDVVRTQLEVLRDEIFNVRGLRWVLCGALGIVQGAASSPRLEGMLHNPIELAGIPDQHARLILPSRIAAYGAIQSPYLPLDPTLFTVLYDLLRGNLRASLSHADNYCQWVVDLGGTLPNSDDDKRQFFHRWLEAETSNYLSSAAQQITPRAWEVFDKAVALGGAFSPSDFPTFDFNSVQALRPHVQSLEDQGLLVSSRDDTDRRRKTVQVTPKGWFVLYARSRQS